MLCYFKERRKKLKVISTSVPDAITAIESCLSFICAPWKERIKDRRRLRAESQKKSCHERNLVAVIPPLYETKLKAESRGSAPTAIVVAVCPAKTDALSRSATTPLVRLYQNGESTLFW